MEIIVSARHADVSEELRSHVEESLSRLTKFEPRATRANVTLLQEKKRCVAEATLSVERGDYVRAEAEGGDLRTAVDRLCDKLARQLKRGRDRRRSHKGPSRAEVPLAEVLPAEDVEA